MTVNPHNAGQLIAVVGPSGVGKDSVMAGLQTALPHIHMVRRVITRAPGLGGETYTSVSVAEFHRMVQAGAFALHWGAHGLHYGVPVTETARLAAGTTCLVNLSRTVLTEAAALFPRLVVLHITARPDVLAQRLAGRGRETGAEITKRLGQAQKPLPAGLDVRNVSNDGPLEQTVAAAVAMLQPVRA